jgi:hypothetical protein
LEAESCGCVKMKISATCFKPHITASVELSAARFHHMEADSFRAATNRHEHMKGPLVANSDPLFRDNPAPRQQPDTMINITSSFNELLKQREAPPVKETFSVEELDEFLKEAYRIVSYTFSLDRFPEVTAD